MTTINTKVLAESLADVSDDEDGFKPEVAEQIKERLEVILKDLGVEEKELSIGTARKVQDTYITNLKNGAYGSGIAAKWNTAEERIKAVQTEWAQAEGLS